jgi:uncharacterized protein (TIGR00251 family)
MYLRVRVVPRSKQTEIKELAHNHLRVRVLSPPSDNRANKELVALLARYYNKRKSSIRIKKGLKSPDKLVEIQD